MKKTKPPFKFGDYIRWSNWADGIGIVYIASNEDENVIFALPSSALRGDYHNVSRFTWEARGPRPIGRWTLCR